MKKLIGLTLCVVMVGLCIIPVLAVDDETHSTGLIWDEWNNLINDEYESTLRGISVNRKGDVNSDGKVTAVDARLCLQAVASEETNYLFLPQGKAADVNNDGKISAVDARVMLQNVAGMTEIVTYAEVTLDDGLNSGSVVGPLQISGGTAYYWQCEVDKDGLTVLERYFDNSEPEVIGGPVNQYFAFTPETKGTYTINFKFANANQTEVIDEFSCVLIVN